MSSILAVPVAFQAIVLFRALAHFQAHVRSQVLAHFQARVHSQVLAHFQALIRTQSLVPSLDLVLFRIQGQFRFQFRRLILTQLHTLHRRPIHIQHLYQCQHRCSTSAMPSLLTAVVNGPVV